LWACGLIPNSATIGKGWLQESMQLVGTDMLLKNMQVIFGYLEFMGLDVKYDIAILI
jgi:hypothetical protein